jgi:hypothetical protein
MVGPVGLYLLFVRLLIQNLTELDCEFHIIFKTSVSEFSHKLNGCPLNVIEEKC